MKSKFTTVVFPVFNNYKVHVEVTSDIKKSLLKREVTRGVSEEMDGNTGGMAVHDTSNFRSYIFLPYNAQVGDIAHEAWHAVKVVMEYIGVELDSETCAYHLGFLTNRIFRFMRGRK